jgi:hypothetical protein
VNDTNETLVLNLTRNARREVRNCSCSCAPQRKNENRKKTMMSNVDQKYLAVIAKNESVDVAYFYNMILNQTAPRIREQFADAEEVHLHLQN